MFVTTPNLAVSPTETFPKKFLKREISSTCFYRFPDLYVEKLFDICSDSTPVEEGLTGITVLGAFLALKMDIVELRG